MATATPKLRTKKFTASPSPEAPKRNPKPRVRIAAGTRVGNPVHGYTIRSHHLSTTAFTRARTVFEAASHSDRVVEAVDHGPNSANGEIERVRMRSRWTYLNDPNYRQACRQVPNNIVHYGIKPVIKDKKLLKLWRRWIKEADARGRLDFYGMQWLTVLGIVRDGEALIRFRDRLPKDMHSKVAFQLQMMEPDHLPLDKTESVGANTITSGVELDPIERVVAYWLLDNHPKDQWTRGSGMPKRVPAHEILHVYMPDRFTGERGYPWGASALNTSESLRSYDIAELERKQGNANVLGILKKPRLAADDDVSVGGDDDDIIETPTMQPMEPNSVMVIPDDYDFSLEAPTQTDNNYGVFRREHLSGLAVSMGLAVEHITLNFQHLGDRQYRAAMLEVQRYFESLQYHMVVRMLCEPVWQRFVSYVVTHDLWAVPEGDDIDDWMDMEWMAPARGYIHPVQEIEAFAKAVKNGFTSRKRVAAQFGEDVEDIDDENHTDQNRSSSMALAYDVYGGGTTSLSDMIEQYGAAVRAGVITPQAQDEEAMRKAFGLPPLSDEAKAFWTENKGVKQPVTLAKKAEMLEEPGQVDDPPQF